MHPAALLPWHDSCMHVCINKIGATVIHICIADNFISVGTLIISGRIRDLAIHTCLTHCLALLPHDPDQVLVDVEAFRDIRDSLANFNKLLRGDG